MSELILEKIHFLGSLSHQLLALTRVQKGWIHGISEPKKFNFLISCQRLVPRVVCGVKFEFCTSFDLEACLLGILHKSKFGQNLLMSSQES